MTSARRSALASPLAASFAAGGMRFLAFCLAAAFVAACSGRPSQPPPAVAQHDNGILPEARLVRTEHYVIHTTATDGETRDVARAVEALYRSYADFSESPPGKAPLELVLYKDRAQFRAHNRSSPWAEAYYLRPRCYAYVAEGRNPHHWMIHEATHQLLRQLSGYRPAKWIDEGLASYFGASRVTDSALQRGAVDRNAYPVWWLPSLGPSGDLDRDIASGRIIPLRQLISNTGPDINRHFNLYYIEYWSLTHFLLHSGGGKHAAAYRELIARGGSLEDFQRLIGPVEAIQPEWYEYLIRLKDDIGNAD